MKITFDEAVEKVGDLAQSGVAKSVQVTEMAKLQVKNMSEQENLKKLYIKLGKYYYDNYSSEPEETLKETCESIQKTKQNIVENNLRIKQLRNPDIILTQDDMPDDTVDIEIETTEE
ncbi:MAG: hypothetical protein R3Y63_01005 [Eubacteriales bacterium]